MQVAQEKIASERRVAADERRQQVAQDAKTRLEAEVADMAEKRDLILQVCVRL